MADHADKPAGLSLRDAAIDIVRTLQGHGHVAYLAGGCVRDRLLGLQPKDYDVATDAPPDVVKRLYRRSALVGESFGVVQVRLGKGRYVEVATFRREWDYADGRRPERVEFADARADASRRDFTINGLFENPLASAGQDSIIDYVGGRADLEARLIRAIGDPQERFGEDYFPHAPGCAFCRGPGFRIEGQTAEAIRHHAAKLDRISRERIAQEMQRMLASQDKPVAAGPSRRHEAGDLIQQLRLDGPVFMEEHRTVELPTLSALAGQASYPTALAAWALDRHAPLRAEPSPHPHPTQPHGPASPLPGRADLRDLHDALHHWQTSSGRALVAHWRKALCLSNDHCEALEGLLKLLPAALSWHSLPVAKRKRLLGRRPWPELWLLLAALQHKAGVALLVEEITPVVAQLLAHGVAPEPLVTGDDLIALGRQPGPDFARILEAAYDAQLEGRVTSRQEALALIQHL